jgi:lipopolysaccharide/colanic/teichoic acid biosynthesis glycosyltransferase
MIWRLKKIAKKKFKETENNNDLIDFSINSQKLKEIQFIYRKTMLISGSIGALIIFIYYMPIIGLLIFLIIG